MEELPQRRGSRSLSYARVFHGPEQITSRDQLRIGQEYVGMRGESEYERFILLEEPEESEGSWWAKVQFTTGSRSKVGELSISLADRGVEPFKHGLWNTIYWLKEHPMDFESVVAVCRAMQPGDLRTFTVDHHWGFEDMNAFGGRIDDQTKDKHFVVTAHERSLRVRVASPRADAGEESTDGG